MSAAQVVPLCCGSQVHHVLWFRRVTPYATQGHFHPSLAHASLWEIDREDLLQRYNPGGLWSHKGHYCISADTFRTWYALPVPLTHEQFRPWPLLLFHLCLADVLLTYSHHGEKRQSGGGIFGGDPRVPYSCLPYPNPEPSVSTKRGMDSGRSWVFLQTP